jgi:hypothetical protein
MLTTKQISKILTTQKGVLTHAHTLVTYHVTLEQFLPQWSYVALTQTYFHLYTILFTQNIFNQKIKLCVTDIELTFQHFGDKTTSLR